MNVTRYILSSSIISSYMMKMLIAMLCEPFVSRSPRSNGQFNYKERNTHCPGTNGNRSLKIRTPKPDCPPLQTGPRARTQACIRVYLSFVLRRYTREKTLCKPVCRGPPADNSPMLTSELQEWKKKVVETVTGCIRFDLY